MKRRNPLGPVELWTAFLLVISTFTASNQSYSIPISSSNTSANATTRLAFSFTSEFDISSQGTLLIGLSSAFSLHDGIPSTLEVFEDGLPSSFSMVELISAPIRSPLRCNCSTKFQSLIDLVAETLLRNDTDSQYILITQPEYTRFNILNQTQLHFSLSNARNPPYAMRIASPAFLVVYNNSLSGDFDPQSLLRIALLDGLDIIPRRIWYPSISMSPMLVGTSASVSISLVLGNSHLYRTLIFTLPKSYTLSSDTLHATLNGEECNWKVKNQQLRIATNLSDTLIVAFDILQPQFEGPIGSILRIDTIDSHGLLMEQGFIDLSHLHLSRASILFDQRHISLREGGPSAIYSLQLNQFSAPTDDTNMTIRISHRFTFSSGCENYSVQLSPSFVIYSKANWTQISSIYVSVPQDSRIQCMGQHSLHHEIQLPTPLETLWAPPNDISLSITDTTLPIIHLSTRHFGIVTEIANVSYAIQPLFQPTESLEIKVQCIDITTQTPFPLLEANPLIVTFDPNDWRPRTIRLFGSNLSSTNAFSLRHSILSGALDVFFTPQSDIFGLFRSSTLCLQCPRGTLHPKDQEQCLPCPPGNACPTTNTSIPCAPGTFAEAGATNCIDCPVGSYCPNTSKQLIIACPMGTFSLGRQDRCTFCPEGYKCPLSDGSANALCPSGTYTLAGGAVTTCIRCPPGFKCPLPSDHEPVPCVPGTFSIGSSAICTPCPAGFACPDTMKNISIACLPGTYAAGSQSSCRPCPGGFSCSLNNDELLPCPMGTYSPMNTANCIECPRGAFCDDAQRFKNCSMGTFSAEGSSTCTYCPPGYECPRPNDDPRPCSIGTFSSGGMEMCLPCRPGYRCSPGSTSSTPIQDECPMGTFCNPSWSLTLCPAGTFGNVTAGQSLTHACHLCPEGYVCEIGSTRNTMRLCPPGYLCPLGTERVSQYPCPSGTFNALFGEYHTSACVVCPSGRFCGQATSDPRMCPRGSFCPEATTSSDQYPCPSGTFSDRTGLILASECTACVPGAFCPQGSASPTQCPAGTFNPNIGAGNDYECEQCPAGWRCPHIGQESVQERCLLGHYCPRGTALPLACPTGTFTNRNDLIRTEECTMCPERFACASGTGGDATLMQMCALGHFCPNKTSYSTQFPCLPGTYSSKRNLAMASECDICPTGSYCVGGKEEIDGPCAAGHYCPEKTSSATRFPCPSGSYTERTNISQPEECEACPIGAYCPQGADRPIPCRPGTFAERQRTRDAGPGTWPSCVSCPAGFYCPSASVRPLPCGVGMYSKENAEKCLLCRSGRFCASNTTSFDQMEMDLLTWKPSGYLYGKCFNGTFCPNGTDHEPFIDADACPPGFVCPRGTPLPLICPAGTINPLAGQDALEDCMETPEGMYSVPGSVSPTGQCVSGFYCPRGSTSAKQTPCPPTYYLDAYGGKSVSDCVICVAGAYCPQATSTPITCPIGYFCPTGVAEPIACPVGTFSASVGLHKREECAWCPPGRFCDAPALPLARGACDPGFFCVIGSNSSTPMLSIHGGPCPRGFYCPRGNAVPVACPFGTYSDTFGLEMVTQCALCPPGKYCQGTGKTEITGECMEGYFCPQGASRPDQELVPAGHFATRKSAAPTACPVGSFSPIPGAIRCLECVEGSFCPIIATITAVECPRGHYCPTRSAWPMKCLPGTFGNFTRLTDSAKCDICPPGMYCDAYGLTLPTGFCVAGFVCSSGSSTRFGGNAIVDKNECPMGHFCPQGTAHPLACPPGTYSNSTKLQAQHQCTRCDLGHYCSESGATSVMGVCALGFFCRRGCMESMPTKIDREADEGGDQCPQGTYCSEGSMEPLPCPPGTYSDAFGAFECRACPMGYFCPEKSIEFTSLSCPMGYFCPSNTTSHDANPCPPGTFGASLRLQSVSQCTQAPAGTFVDSYGAIAPAGLCAKGFYCTGGSSSSAPAVTSSTGGTCGLGFSCPEGSSRPIACAAGRYCPNDTQISLPCAPGFYCVQGSFTSTPMGQVNDFGIIGNVCPQGHFCPENCSHQVPCPPGTYSDNTQLMEKRDCQACTPGFVCNASATIRPQHFCPEGYFCPGGDRQAVWVCPKGAACPSGSISPTMCASGSYSDTEAAVACAFCPVGYFCPFGSIRPEACPRGFYCPGKTPRSTSFPCLPGTFGNGTHLTNAEGCLVCPEGSYCTGGSDGPTGACSPGFYCRRGARISTPNDTTGGQCDQGFVCLGGASLPSPRDRVTGHACDPGFHCPKGSMQQLPCPLGTFNPIQQGDCRPCPEGMFCEVKTIQPVPCGVGSYCPLGTSVELPCPSGTFGNDTGLVDASQCTLCVAGRYCVNGRVTGFCSAGYFCSRYNASPHPESHEGGGPCPLGHYCPQGVHEPIPCPRNTARLTQYGVKVEDCEPCPLGMDCTDGTRTRWCLKGFFCRSGMDPISCPKGSFNNETGKTQREDCRTCKAGRLCNDTGIIDPERYPCPRGAYCPEGAIDAIPCPDGMYGDRDGAHGIDFCKMCLEGSFCSQGASRPQVCSPSTYCPFGAGKPLHCPPGSFCGYNSSAPMDCPPGYVCPASSAVPTPCERGFYCPGNTAFAIPCPLGSIGRSTPSNGSYTMRLESCQLCPKGTYADTFLQRECSECEPGFVCMGGTTSNSPLDVALDQGYPCPVGHFCPRASHFELPCPPGTYQPKERAGNVSECLLCPLGTYQIHSAATSCVPCSRSSFTLFPGSTQCKCKGSNRAFQRSDGFCTCEPGFEYFENGVSKSDQDSDIDCQPIVYDRCAASQIRADNGSCVSSAKIDCSAVCPEGKGVFLESAGLCECKQQVLVDDVCDAKCRQETVRLHVNATTSQLQLFDPMSKRTSDTSPSGILAKVSCAQDDDCQLHTLVLEAFGFSGSYDIPSELENTRRRLTALSTLVIPNPIICIERGGGIAFDIEDGDTRSYPVYLKDSMLNTNPEFDYGAFRALAMRMESNASNVSVFAFTFMDPGMYIFGTSRNFEARTIVSVMKKGTICPLDAPIVPMNEQNLVTIGALRSADIIVAPDWGLVAGMIVGLFVLVGCVIAALYLIQKKRWKTRSKEEAVYRKGHRTEDLTAICESQLGDVDDCVDSDSYWWQEEESELQEALQKTLEKGLRGTNDFFRENLKRIELGNEQVKMLTAKALVSLETGEALGVDTMKALVTFLDETVAMDHSGRQTYGERKRELLHRMSQQTQTMILESRALVQEKSDSERAERAKEALRELKSALESPSKLSALRMEEVCRWNLSQVVFHAIYAKMEKSVDDSGRRSAIESVKKEYEQLTLSRKVVDNGAEALEKHFCVDFGKKMGKLERVVSCMENEWDRKHTQKRAFKQGKEGRLNVLLKDLLQDALAMESELERAQCRMKAMEDEERQAEAHFRERLKGVHETGTSEGTSTLRFWIEKEFEEMKKLLSSLLLKYRETFTAPSELPEVDQLVNTSWLAQARSPPQVPTGLGVEKGSTLVQRKEKTVELIAQREPLNPESDNNLEIKYKEEEAAIEEEYRKELDELEKEFDGDSCSSDQNSEIRNAKDCVLFSEEALWSKISNLESPFFEILQTHRTPQEQDSGSSKAAIGVRESLEGRNITQKEALCKEMIAEAVREALEGWNHPISHCREQYEQTIQRIQSMEDGQNSAILSKMEKARDEYESELSTLKLQMRSQLMEESRASQNSLREHIEKMERMRNQQEKEQISETTDPERISAAQDRRPEMQKLMDQVMEETVRAESRRIAGELISGNVSDMKASDLQASGSFVEEQLTKLAKTQKEALRIQQERIHADTLLQKEKLRNRIQKRVQSSQMKEDEADDIDLMAEEEKALVTANYDEFLADASSSLREAVQQTISDVNREIRNCIAVFDSEKEDLALELRATRTERDKDLERNQVRNFDESEEGNTQESDRLQEEIRRDEKKAWEQLQVSHEAQLQSLRAKASFNAMKKKNQAATEEVEAQEELERIRSENILERQHLDQELLADQRNVGDRLKQRIAEKRHKNKFKSNKIVVEEDVVEELDESSSQKAAEQILVDRIRSLQLEQAKLDVVQRAIDTTFSVELSKISEQVNEIPSTTTPMHSPGSMEDVIQSTLEEKKSPEQMEELLRRCKDAHEQEAKRLKMELQADRQRQEHALKERIRARREKKAISVLPIGMETAQSSLETEFEQQNETLQASIEAEEAAAWSSIRQKQQEELRALTLKAQAIAQRKQEEAIELERFAAQELQRLQGEHVEDSKQLQASMSSEKQRQEKCLQERVAKRRERKLSQVGIHQAEDVQSPRDETLSSVESSEDATLTTRIDEAKQAAEKAASEAHKAAQIVDEMKAESLRAMEVERVAKEYAEKQSELKRLHHADKMTQRRRLEARINAKKQKKLQDLDTKREKEIITRLHFDHEELAGTMECNDVIQSFQTAKDAVDAIEYEDINIEEHKDAILADGPSGRRMESYLSTLKRLIDGNIVPGNLPIEAAVELILDPCHHSEAAEMFAKHTTGKKRAIQRILEYLTQRRTEERTRLLSVGKASEQTEALLSDLDKLFHERMTQLEHQVDENMDQAHGLEIAQMRDRHKSEAAFLIKYAARTELESLETREDAPEVSFQENQCELEKGFAVRVETLRVECEGEVKALEGVFADEMEAQDAKWNELLQTESEALDKVWSKTTTKSTDKEIQWKMMHDKLHERHQFRLTQLRNRLEKEKQAIWEAFRENERLLRSEMTLQLQKEQEHNVQPRIDLESCSNLVEGYRLHVHKELAKVCNHHRFHVKCIENSSFLSPIDVSKGSDQLKEYVKYFSSILSSMTGELTSLMLFDADTMDESIDLFYNPIERSVHLSVDFVENSNIGQSIVLLLLGLCQVESQTDEITDPKFISCYFQLLIRSYQHLFDRSSIAPIPERNRPRISPAKWESRAQEIQSFLCSLEIGDEHNEFNKT
uniref:Uncharacterized protein AlNc14C24G2403 n=1 Tax=Albugo laibachii Nc14 TaxID=890382 RepID=F0W6A3_9STRA|nr:conserved hypothetical protein [Albugo laibachii Nc14]|eukprot:CCA16646.1 conserved hypothetical protein [Albugo laibachii Nc14]